MSGLKDYFSLVKISHTVFSLPFALIGFFLAAGEKGTALNLRTLLLVLLCVFFARNAAMAFNRYADRDIDKKNPRTAFREIPRARISPGSALGFVVLNAVLFIVATAFLNMVCLILSPVAMLVVLSYSFTKRFTWLSHLFLGLGLALVPIGAYLAVTAHFNLIPVLLSICVLFWVAGFDILYSLQDLAFDRQERLRSIPASWGVKTALILSGIFHLTALVLLFLAGILRPFHLFYWIGLGVFALLIIYQHSLVKPNDLSRINLAFATLNGFASILFAAFVIADLYLRLG